MKGPPRHSENIFAKNWQPYSGKRLIEGRADTYSGPFCDENYRPTLISSCVSPEMLAQLLEGGTTCFQPFETSM